MQKPLTDGRRRLRMELGHTRCLLLEWLWWWSDELVVAVRSWWWCSLAAVAISFPRSADPPLDAAAAVDWAIRGGILCINDADELCRRVLTTSSGHVTTAPAVPAILGRGKEKELVSQWCSGLCVQLNLLKLERGIRLKDPGLFQEFTRKYSLCFFRKTYSSYKNFFVNISSESYNNFFGHVSRNCSLNLAKDSGKSTISSYNRHSLIFFWFLNFEI